MTNAEYQKALQKLGDLCRRWHGELRRVDQVNEEYIAPFTSLVGLDWGRWTIFHRRPPSWRDNEFVVGAIIHEMAHVFATAERPDDIVDETPFLGWEYAVAVYAGMGLEAWQRSLVRYQLDDRYADQMNTAELVRILGSLISEPFVIDGQPQLIRHSGQLCLPLEGMKDNGKE